MSAGNIQMTLTVYQSSKMGLFTLRYERFLKDDLIYDDVYIRTERWKMPERNDLKGNVRHTFYGVQI